MMDIIVKDGDGDFGPFDHLVYKYIMTMILKGDDNHDSIH